MRARVAPFGRASRIAARIAAVCVLAACHDATGPTTLTVELVPVTTDLFPADGTWPTSPAISGGTNVTVDGTAFVGCGHLQATATRVEHAVTLVLTPTDDAGPCPSDHFAWEYYRARIPLDPGEYSVKAIVRSSGGEHDESAIATVQIHSADPGDAPSVAP